MWTTLKTAPISRFWRHPLPLAAVLLASVCGTAVSAAEPMAVDSAHHDHGQQGQDVAAVRHVMMATWDRPDARLSVEPVVVRGTYAVASWAQGERGGRAFLSRRGSGPWQVVLCAGDGIRSAVALQEMGLSMAEAESMATQWAAEEAALPATQRAKFSSFEGVVRMDEHGHHPPAAASEAEPGHHHHGH